MVIFHDNSILLLVVYENTDNMNLIRWYYIDVPLPIISVVGCMVRPLLFMSICPYIHPYMS